MTLDTIEKLLTRYNQGILETYVENICSYKPLKYDLTHYGIAPDRIATDRELQESFRLNTILYGIRVLAAERYDYKYIHCYPIMNGYYLIWFGDNELITMGLL